MSNDQVANYYPIGEVKDLQVFNLQSPVQAVPMRRKSSTIRCINLLAPLPLRIRFSRAQYFKFRGGRTVQKVAEFGKQ